MTPLKFSQRGVLGYSCTTGAVLGWILIDRLQENVVVAALYEMGVDCVRVPVRWEGPKGTEIMPAYLEEDKKAASDAARAKATATAAERFEHDNAMNMITAGAIARASAMDAELESGCES